MTTEPFTDVQYRFTPTAKEAPDMEGDEYVVLGPLRSPRIGVRSGREWWWSSASIYERPVITHLLTDLQSLKDYIGTPGGPPYDELVRENDRLKADLARLGAERDVYQESLEHTDGSLKRISEALPSPPAYVLNLYSIVRHSLSQGRKLREGE